MTILKRTQNLRLKSILLLTLTQVLLFVVVFITVRIFAANSINDLENYYAQESASLVERTLVSTSDSLSNTVQDWAIWDDSYHFIEGSYPDYEASNLTYDTFRTLDINLVVFYNGNQEAIFSSYFNYEDLTETTIDISIMQFFEELNIPQNTSKEHFVSGILTTKFGIFSIASYPITKHSEDSDVIGNLVFAKQIDQSSIDTLGITLGFSFEIIKNTTLDRENPIFVEETLQNQILINQLIDDLLSRSDYMIQIKTDKKVTSAVNQTPVQFAISLFVVALVYALITLTYLDKNIFKRLEKLKDEIQKIAENIDSIEHVYVSLKKDEIDFIGYKINDMLDTIDNSRQKIIAMSHEDYLTKIPNKKWFDEHLEKLLELAMQSDDKLAVLFIDIDDFKGINDSNGHDSGDIVLIKLGNLFQANLEDGESIARIGGDEFLVVLKYETIDEVNQITTRLFHSLDEWFLKGDIKYRITISIGIALYPENGLTRSELILNADTALYGSKRSGKNTVTYFSDLK